MKGQSFKQAPHVIIFGHYLLMQYMLKVSSQQFQTVESLMQNRWLATALDVQRDMYLMGQSMHINSFPYHIK